MLEQVVAVERAGYAVRAVRCRDDHAGWSAEAPPTGHRLVLVRSGAFRRRVNGRVALVDPAQGYLVLPGDEEEFAHPFGGDECTSFDISPRLWPEGAAGADRSVPVDARLELAHRLALRSTTGPDPDFAGVERLMALAEVALRRPPAATSPRGAAQAAREAIVSGHPAAGGLVPLAGLVAVSPYYLSRAFRRETGMTVSRFRNRVRVSRALHRLAEGERDLGVLAADLGFADQAHMTRTIRAVLGETPAALRHLLSPAGR